MTDRDAFAAAALTGLIALNCPSPNQQAPSDLCEFAFRWADAMLRERERHHIPDAGKMVENTTNHDPEPAGKAASSDREPDLSSQGGTGNTQEPVAWMVARNGEPCHLSWTLGDARRELNRLELVSTGTPALELFSLYRSPTLTDAEREAINVARIELNTLHCFEEHHSHTLLKLLERTQ